MVQNLLDSLDKRLLLGEIRHHELDLEIPSPLSEQETRVKTPIRETRTTMTSCASLEQCKNKRPAKNRHAQHQVATYHWTAGSRRLFKLLVKGSPD